MTEAQTNALEYLLMVVALELREVGRGNTANAVDQHLRVIKSERARTVTASEPRP